MPDRIVVDGLKELRAALKALGDAEGTSQLKRAGQHVVTEIVIPGAQSRAGGLGRMQARAAATLRPASVGNGAAVRYGAGVPFAMGAEFGALQDVRRRTSRGFMRGWNQFMGHRGQEGYFLWPTIRDEETRILEMYGDALVEVFDRAG